MPETSIDVLAAKFDAQAVLLQERDDHIGDLLADLQHRVSRLTDAFASFRHDLGEHGKKIVRQDERLKRVEAKSCGTCPKQRDVERLDSRLEALEKARMDDTRAVATRAEEKEREQQATVFRAFTQSRGVWWFLGALLFLSSLVAGLIKWLP